MRLEGDAAVFGDLQLEVAGDDVVLRADLVVVIGTVAVKHGGAKLRRDLSGEERLVKGDFRGVLGVLVRNGKDEALAGIVCGEDGVYHIHGVVFIFEPAAPDVNRQHVLLEKIHVHPHDVVG